MRLVFLHGAAAAGKLTTARELVRPGLAVRVRQVVEEAGGRVCFVRLTVTDEEQERRIGNADRLEFHKLSEIGTLHRMRQHGAADVEQPPVDLEIVTDRSTASESAELIAAYFALRPQAVSERYPPV